MRKQKREFYNTLQFNSIEEAQYVLADAEEKISHKEEAMKQSYIGLLIWWIGIYPTLIISGLIAALVGMWIIVIAVFALMGFAFKQSVKTFSYCGGISLALNVALKVYNIVLFLVPIALLNIICAIAAGTLAAFMLVFVPTPIVIVRYKQIEKDRESAIAYLSNVQNMRNGMAPVNNYAPAYNQPVASANNYAPAYNQPMAPVNAVPMTSGASFCSHCGKPLTANSKFCSVCGNPVR